jgi:CPA1 family monovalent cation:H+ antiporter
LSLPAGEIRNLLVTVTYIVVVFSILVQGLTLAPVVRAMAHRADVEMERTSLPGLESDESDVSTDLAEVGSDETR